MVGQCSVVYFFNQPAKVSNCGYSCRTAATFASKPFSRIQVNISKNSFGNDMRPAFASLMPLLDATGARPTTLAQRAGITKQAISQLIRDLEARGYVEQVSDPSDTRAKLARLTQRGVALGAACAEARLELHSIGLAKLGKLRVSRLRRDLTERAIALEG